MEFQDFEGNERSQRRKLNLWRLLWMCSYLQRFWLKWKEKLEPSPKYLKEFCWNAKRDGGGGAKTGLLQRLIRGTIKVGCKLANFNFFRFRRIWRIVDFIHSRQWIAIFLAKMKEKRMTLHWYVYFSKQRPSQWILCYCWPLLIV